MGYWFLALLLDFLFLAEQRRGVNQILNPWSAALLSCSGPWWRQHLMTIGKKRTKIQQLENMCRLFKLEIGLKHFWNITISTFNMETIIHLHLEGQQPHYQKNIIMLLCMYVLYIFISDEFLFSFDVHIFHLHFSLLNPPGCATDPLRALKLPR